MATPKQKAEKAIDLIKEVQLELERIYKDEPDMHIRATNVLNRLANGFAHAAGISVEIGGVAENNWKGEEPTHIMGIPIPKKDKINVVEASTPTYDDRKDLEGFVEVAFDEFQTVPAEELREQYNDFVIRAVATKCGLPVTPTEPAEITMDFINEVKAAAIKKAEEITIANGGATDEKIKAPTKSKTK